jgi:hypothetical protein
MASDYKTPGVYIEEKNAFPGSVVAIATAVPVFIGYTEKAERNGSSIQGEPVKISSFLEYVQWFGDGFQHKFTFNPNISPASPLESMPAVVTSFKADMLTQPHTMFYFYNCIRLFYQNGGSDCYIMSVGVYGEGDTDKKTAISSDDFGDSVFEKLQKTFEPTMVLVPDLAGQTTEECYKIYVKILKHCKETQSRFGVFDVIKKGTSDFDLKEDIEEFRTKIGSEALNYGAAYYPWLNTSIVAVSEVSFKNLTNSEADFLPIFLNSADAKSIRDIRDEVKEKIDAELDPVKKKSLQDASDTQVHQSLVAVSEVYKQLMAEIRFRLNLLPPSSAMAGVYSLVDSTRGVWKSPANISLSSVNSPVLNISSHDQENMNIDAVTGKSINAIRPFPGLGSLVWGARTLDGNSQDWRYINVRRTMIMIEQSLKLACRAYVFEPNDSATWVTMKSMMNDFLSNLWKQGALAGAKPEQAFDVKVGLGATMTPTDILDGYLRVTVMLAMVRPAEFIVLTFQQQQQQSYS